MGNLTGTIASAPIDNIWSSISNLSNKAKLELIKRLSESMLRSANIGNSEVRKRERFLSLAGAWNDDPKADEMDKAALSARNEIMDTRNISFD